MRISFKKLFWSTLFFLTVLSSLSIPCLEDALFGIPTGQVFAEIATFKISGYIEPDFNFDNPDLKSGFLVELVGFEKSVLSDSTGYFEIKDVPSNSIGYTVKISKSSYLYRLIENVEVTRNIQIGSKSEPVKMWAGDALINGAQDNAINIADVFQIARCFNSTLEDENYNADLDINKNGAINIEDVVIVVRHFNMTPSDYTSVSVTKDNDGEFMFKIRTTEKDQAYSFPILTSYFFMPGENNNIVVDWGDGTISKITNNSGISHTYEFPDTYTIKVISFTYFPIDYYKDKMLIEILTPIPDIGATSFELCFYGCENLEKIPNGLFSNNINATNFGHCFENCINLKNIPEGLFENNINATEFGFCFYNCKSLENIPEGLFKYSTNANSFAFCFAKCESLVKIPQGLFKYNIKATDFSRCFSDCLSLTEIPAGLFDNNIDATDFYGCFLLCEKIKNIPNGLFDNNIKATDFSSCFGDCNNLTKIPQGLFNNNINATDFSRCFNGCVNLTEIPAGLFDNNINATDFSECFKYCTYIKEIPKGLFDNNIKATNFSKCFYYCLKLSIIPDGLFDNNINVTDFSYCFYFCNSLTEIPDGLFNNNDKAVNFSDCFRNCIELEGLAPALWLRPNVQKYSGCFYGCTKLSNYDDIPGDWK